MNSEAPRPPLGLPETKEDRLDRWIRDDAGYVPGGELVAIPIETGERPTLPARSERERVAREGAARAAAKVVAELTPEKMLAIAEDAREDNRRWRVERGYDTAPSSPRDKGHSPRGFLRSLREALGLY